MEPKYDVAISFLSADEPIATALTNLLCNGLSVFFYPRSQESLGGTDGMESMRKPFFDDSRLVVVLYRKPWGKTPWTGVEQTAIQEGCLEQGWRKLFFLMLDDSVPPLWLPETRVRFNYPVFGIEEAAGAIKARVQDLGGLIVPLTPETRAAQYKTDSQFRQEKAKLRSIEGWGIVRDNASKLFGIIKKRCSELAPSFPLEVGSDDGDCVIRTMRASLTVSLFDRANNPGLLLRVREWNKKLALPRSREIPMYLGDNPRIVSEYILLPDLARDRTQGWAKDEDFSSFLSSETLADQLLIQFIELIDKAERGALKGSF